MQKFIYEYAEFDCPICKSKLSRYHDSSKPYGKQLIIECKNGCYHVEGWYEEWLIRDIRRYCGWNYNFK